eukprot:CAMPEP_0183373220 /NCGR_PEP_ID=MMETSP0164_2-20130417/110818_1 /TAXON_ID=221442 /ORGANISM="Coccolithus pelagicus ssp braarudi, Strain PLY182g" /LENGTH=69 /DNA_ID=CAMNT_0025550071 /DNA_START=37 /DNA_END=243 /DNA_ORIENTATION=+
MAPSAVTRLFVSHMHGDHVFGLPGMVCQIAQACRSLRENERNDGWQPSAPGQLQVIGPEGLRSWVRTVL